MNEFSASRQRRDLWIRAGVTMIELLVVIGIVVSVSTIGMRFMQSVGKSQKAMSAQTNLQMEARRAFDKAVEQVREGTELVRPYTGETLPFLIFKDIVNRTTILYLEPNNPASEKLNRRVYKLVSYRTNYTGSYDSRNEKVLLDAVRGMTFTSLSPNGVQVNAAVIHEQDEFQFLAHIGLMNLGGLE
ncbi:MAG TPA: hypothetical protein PLP29_07105 [Candidatus Ozemobacteraceae bacterium]|nr:hypothetical protein [Candidatus Ozemobacteraceae bacterium]